MTELTQYQTQMIVPEKAVPYFERALDPYAVALMASLIEEGAKLISDDLTFLSLKDKNCTQTRFTSFLLPVKTFLFTLSREIVILYITLYLPF